MNNMHVLIKIKLQVYYEIDLLTFVYNRDCVNMFCKQYKEGRKGSKLISKVATCWTSISCKQLNVIVVVVQCIEVLRSSPATRWGHFERG